MTDAPTGIEVAPSADAAGAPQRLHLVRWTCTTGSNTRSRGAVVVESGDHRWQASAEGNGPVEALFRAVDDAIHDVLTGHPRLTAYDVHALADSPAAEGRVTVRIAPPSGAEGTRAHGEYEGVAQATNIIAASVEAYLEALNELLAEEQWAGATDSAGNFRAAPSAPAPTHEYDRAAAKHATTDWFDR